MADEYEAMVHLGTDTTRLDDDDRTGREISIHRYNNAMIPDSNTKVLLVGCTMKSEVVDVNANMASVAQSIRESWRERIFDKEPRMPVCTGSRRSSAAGAARP